MIKCETAPNGNAMTAKYKNIEYIIPGRLPSHYLIEEFLEEVKKDIGIARNVAALAMSMVAKAHISKFSEGDE